MPRFSPLSHALLALPALLLLTPSFTWRWTPRARRTRTRLAARQLEAEDFRELLERPEGAKDLQEILKEMLADEEQLKDSNETFQQLTAAQRGEQVSDPLVRFLTDPQQVWSWMQSSEKTEQLAAMMNRSPLFDKLRAFGAAVLEKRQVAQLPPGSLVEVNGLKEASQLNGLVGELVEALPEELLEHGERRIVTLEGHGRLAIHPKNLVFPRHHPGDAVILDAEFEPGTEHEGLEQRAAVVSQLTEEEKKLGFDEKSGRLVVDVLSLLPGGPVLERILMWPEHLVRRPFLQGDGVELRDLRDDGELNGALGTVEGPGSVRWSYLVQLQDGRRLEVRWKNLLLTSVGSVHIG